uniref:Uncharacterized protein n=1 Tax=viral metagenome TaxID=1070528 RepID=A0A6C0BBV1_9ZZZZ
MASAIAGLFGMAPPDPLAAVQSMSNLTTLNTNLTSAASTANVLAAIPGVNPSQIDQMNKLIAENTTFANSAAGLPAATIAAQNANFQAQQEQIVRDAQTQAAEKAAADAAAAKKAAQENKENKKFSFKRMMKRAWDHGKWWLLGITIGLLALWGGSISSNNAISEPVYMRFYYLIYGSLLFPVSFIFAIVRWFTGVKGAYYAILAPLVEGPIKNPFYAILLYIFTFDPGTVVIQVQPVKPKILEEKAVLATAAANSAGAAGAAAAAAAAAQAQAQAQAVAPGSGPLSSAPPGTLPAPLKNLSPNALKVIEKMLKEGT